MPGATHLIVRSQPFWKDTSLALTIISEIIIRTIVVCLKIDLRTRTSSPISRELWAVSNLGSLLLDPFAIILQSRIHISCNFGQVLFGFSFQPICLKEFRDFFEFILDRLWETFCLSPPLVSSKTFWRTSDNILAIALGIVLIPLFISIRTWFLGLWTYKAKVPSLLISLGIGLCMSKFLRVKESILIHSSAKCCLGLEVSSKVFQEFHVGIFVVVRWQIIKCT